MLWKSKMWIPLLFVALLHAPAGATIVPPVDVATLVDEADLIFVGSVAHSQAVPTRDATFAFTYITFTVEETIKGATRGRNLTLRFAGGETDTNAFSVGGAPRFEIGDKHLLFVTGNDRLAVPLVGWRQGKLEVVPHPMTRQPILIDQSRMAIDGIAANQWVRGGLALGRDGLLIPPAEPNVKVIAEEGVRVTVEQAVAERVTAAAPAAKVLAELRAFAKGRAAAPGYRQPPIVESASPANVPATFRFDAQPAGGK